MCYGLRGKMRHKESKEGFSEKAGDVSDKNNTSKPSLVFTMCQALSRYHSMSILQVRKLMHRGLGKHAQVTKPMPSTE